MSKKNVNQQEEKPLLKLIKNLVNFADNEEKTVLTNSHLTNILYKELNVNIWSSHPLEVEVYMSILKKFLKQWPNWDNVEKIVQKSKIDPEIDIEKILNQEYESFKKYLKEMLKLSKEITDENVAKVLKNSKDKKGESTTNVVLEVSCTRGQLNKLFFTQPHPQLEDTIFNIDQGSSKIQIQVCKMEELLYWPNLSFHATVGPFEFVRTNKLHLQHTLINKRLNYTNREEPKISQLVHCRTVNRALLGSSIQQQYAIDFFKNLIGQLQHRTLHRVFIQNLLLSIVKDLTLGPQNIDQGNEYMYFPSRHGYVRYLQSDVHSVTKPALETVDYNKYLLHLEEIIIPSVMFKLKRNMVEMSNEDVLKALITSTEPWIKVECLECNAKFDGMFSMTDLKNHILYNHCDEPDVQCMNCKKEFAMRLMAFNCWKHECVANN